jgi:septum site-determining protein MinD
MTRVIVIASSKGGVGKTTTAVNLGFALQQFGRSVLVLDANVHTPNLSIHLGHPLVQTTLVNVLAGEAKIDEAAYKHVSGLKIIPSSISLDQIKQINVDALPEVILDLEGTAEAVLVDSAAGLGKEFLAAIKSADEVIVVTNPELPSVVDAKKTIEVAENHGKEVLGIVLNEFRGDDFDMDVKNVESILEKPIIAIIPHDISVRESLKLKQPVVYSHPNKPASIGFKQLAAYLIGEKYVHSLAEEEKKNKFNTVLKKIGLKK